MSVSEKALRVLRRTRMAPRPPLLRFTLEVDAQHLELIIGYRAVAAPGRAG